MSVEGYNELEEVRSDDEGSSLASDTPIVNDVKESKRNSNTAHLYVFTAEKGGMQGFDKNLQQEVIEQLSKGSKHLEHAKRADDKLTVRIKKMREKLQHLDDKIIQQNLKAADSLITSFERERLCNRWCAVVDMDMFYAAVEIKDNPRLSTVPLAVGGQSMISTTNYIARRYGVRAAMPGFIGQELCRRQGAELTFVNHHPNRYSEEAATVRSVFAKYGKYSSLSLDEARIDLTDSVSQYASSHSISEQDAAGIVLSNLRSDIFEATKLTASGSVARNFLLAKIGSDVNKPNGQFVAPISQEKILQWMTDMSIRKIPGIGKVTERFLKEALKVETAGDVLRRRAIVHSLLDSSKSIFKACLGISGNKLADYSNLPPKAVKRQSIGAERTFSGESNEQMLLTTLAKLCGRVARDMEKQGNLSGKTVVIKVKRTDFQVLTRQVAINHYIKSDKDIYSHASALLEKEFPLSVRLLGVRMTKFKNQISYKQAKDTSQLRLTSFCKPSTVKKDKPTVIQVSEHSDTGSNDSQCSLLFNEDTCQSFNKDISDGKNDNDMGFINIDCHSCESLSQSESDDDKKRRNTNQNEMIKKRLKPNSIETPIILSAPSENNSELSFKKGTPASPIVLD